MAGLEPTLQLKLRDFSQNICNPNWKVAATKAIVPQNHPGH